MALSLAACGSSSGSSSASQSGSASGSTSSGTPTKLTLILRGGTYADVIKAALPAFEAENNVTCEVLDLAFDDLHSKIALDAVNSQGAYDLCMGRLGAQVIAGVGFIGAGTIIVTRRRRVKGLTTAAGLWVAAIVGLAAGAGFYEGAIFTTLLILLAELLLSKLEYRIMTKPERTKKKDIPIAPLPITD